MRLDRIWTVAKKDMSEFRTNKYVMFSLILMPLIMALVLPTIYLTPFTMFAEPNEPFSLEISEDERYFNKNITGGSFVNTTFVDCVVVDVVAESCSFEGVRSPPAWCVRRSLAIAPSATAPSYILMSST